MDLPVFMPQTFDGQPFRWKLPLGIHARPAVPPGDYEVRLDTNGIHAGCRTDIDGCRLPPVGARTSGPIAFSADHTMLKVGPSQYVAHHRHGRAPGARRSGIRTTFVPREGKATVSETCGTEASGRFHS